MRERGTSRDASVVEVDEISKKFGPLVAVQPTSFVVPAGELMTLLGPSGSGKTTILKIIAGFEEPSAGMVRIAGGDVTRVPPHKRNLGFVFQQYALFPHLTVAQNIAYPLQMRRVPASEIKTRVAEALDLIRLGGLEERRPAQLSGGQQQRVALARAIVFRPPVLLMDEPMSALDKRLREEMQYEVRRLQKQLGITTIAVTHDQTEALVMSDSIIVLNKGRIEQIGSPHEVYKRPSSEFVANFLGESNIFRGVVERRSSGAVLACDNDIAIPLGPGAAAGDASGLAYIVRPESISIGADAHAAAIHVKARIVEAIFSGDAIRVVAEAGLGAPVIAKLLAREAVHVPRAGEEVTLNWRAADATVLPASPNPGTP